jgi:hypothetical protein
MNHTKAPWIVVPTIDGRIVIAEMVTWKDKDEQMCNTLLISNAPNMHEVLRQIVLAKDLARLAIHKLT